MQNHSMVTGEERFAKGFGIENNVRSKKEEK
jgi:hypothetical protein